MPAVMITDGNNVHAPDYHAEVTAEKIVVVGPDVGGETLVASRALRKAIEKILVDHHGDVHVAEQAALAEHGMARLDHELDATPHVNDGTVAKIVAAASGTVLQAHFARPEVQDVIREILHHETRSQMHVHRLVFKRADQLARGPRLVS